MSELAGVDRQARDRLDLHIETMQKLADDPAFAYGKTLPENQWYRLQLNKQTLKDMGRDERGAPLPVKEKNGKAATE